MKQNLILTPKHDDDMRVRGAQLRAAERRWGREHPLSGNANTLPKPRLTFLQRVKRWWSSP